MPISTRACKKYGSGGGTALFTHPTGRAIRGALSILPSLPLDILYEIFCFLHPSDLLALARTSKALRHLLLTGTSSVIWRSARENVDGLPERPSDMSEVQYAALVFGLGCHYNGCDRKARDTVWHLRIRSCAGCRPKHQPVKAYENSECHAARAMLGCCFTTLQLYLPCGPFFNPKGNPVKGFHVPLVKLFKDEYQTLPLQDREAYLAQRKKETEVINRFTAAGMEWQNQVKQGRIMEARGKRAARAEVIRDMLLTAGFREDIDYFGWDRISRHPLIGSTQPLTDKIRHSILLRLADYMSGWQELRMEEQVYVFRRQLFLDAWHEFTTTAFFNPPSDCPYLPLPPSATIGLSENIDAIIRQPGHISKESLLEQLYTAFLPTCDYILEWHRSVRRELAALLPDYNPDDDNEAIHARLKLAATVFRCTTGKKCQMEEHPLTYPEILFHPCFTLCPPEEAAPKDPRGIARQKARMAMDGNSWDCKGRVQAHHKQRAVIQVLSCCGKDPQSTTSTEMDKEDPRLACLECSSDRNGFAFMSWRRAVLHNITFHPNSSMSQPWRLAGNLLRAQITAAESSPLPPLPNMSAKAAHNYSVCLHCPPRIPSWFTRFGLANVIAHLKNKHNVVDPAYGRDYKIDTNIAPVYPHPVILMRPSMDTASHALEDPDKF